MHTGFFTSTSDIKIGNGRKLLEIKYIFSQWAQYFNTVAVNLTIILVVLNTHFN
jgi:hypothetical protein